ncbi:MAG: NADH-quinone oxidoreductase subunit A [Bdellovibrionales bacterium]|nr:NADH-quinone oxidoreductase subunit A [Bdellovibrionales bacterium]
MEFLFIFLFILLAALFVTGGLVASRLVAPHRPGRVKNRPYECGNKSVGPAWVQFNVAYYLLALLFLVFDVEAAFLFPWALAFRGAGWVGFLEVLIFVGVLGVGLLYAWKKGALEWV